MTQEIPGRDRREGPREALAEFVGVGHHATPARAGCALLVLEQHGQPSSALGSAWSLARSLGLELHVLRVLRQQTLRRWFSGLHIGGRSSLRRRARDASEADQAWCDQVLGPSVAAVHVRVGNFFDEASSFAERLGVSVVLVPPREGRLGARVISLAGALHRPVLVLRGAGHFRSLVAATDLEDDEYPVLRTAVELGQRLDASVVAVHNVSPLACVLPLEAAFAATVVIGADTVRLRRQRLTRASAELTPSLRTVVANQSDTVASILGQVRSEADDLVLVGTRTKPWLDRLIVRSIAAEVVDRARASVLVTPIRHCPWLDALEYRRRSRRAAAGVPSARAGSTVR